VGDTLNYWTPAGAQAPRALPAGMAAGRAEPVDWLTLAVVVCVAAAGAFSIVIAMAWVLGR
jgi:hypothetical protein